MARQKSTLRKLNTKNKKSTPSKDKNPRRGNGVVASDPIIDRSSKRKVGGVVLVVFALIILTTILIPNDALVTGFIARTFRLVFGIGIYALVIFIVVLGITLLYKSNENSNFFARVTIGLVVILFAFLTLIALFSPGTGEEQIKTLFSLSVVTTHGGYVGAGIAWALLNLFGNIISCIIAIALIIVGLIVLGFSFSKLYSAIQNAYPQDDDLDSYKEAVENNDDEVGLLDEEHDSLPFARIKQNNTLYDSDKRKTMILRKNGPTKRPLNDTPTALSTESFYDFDVEDESNYQNTYKDSNAIDKANAQANSDNNIQTAMTRKLSTAKKTSPKKEKLGSQSNSQTRPLGGENSFKLPPFNILKITKNSSKNKVLASELNNTAIKLQNTLEDFGIEAQVVGWIPGPTVTLYKIDLPAGVRVNRITNLNDDIALALAAPGVRIFAPIPGTNYVGIEVPNAKRQTVLLGDVLKDAHGGPLQIAIGKDVEGNCVVSDLATMPHLLIGGTTGSGKSVSINAMIMSILMRSVPADVRLILIDPKRVEFTPYNGIPHLYVPVVTEPKEAASALSWGVAEMERRLKVFSKVGARNIQQYNSKIQNNEIEDDDVKKVPYIVIIIDELADLMMNVGKEVELSISRIAQLARAAGIHLIIATQRPSTNVVTGLIKANITNRIAFNVASGIDSRVILDTPGAESLIGLGDLLFSKPELAKPQRIQGCFVSEQEINTVVSHLKDQGEPEYHSEVLNTNLITLGASSTSGSGKATNDPLLWDAAEIVVSNQIGSTSNIQRRLSIGYSRAGRIMDCLEEKGVVGPANGSKPREVLVDILELESLKALDEQDDLNVV